MSKGVYRPSTDEAAREQVRLYERTGGREGATMMGRPVVILTTVGARSGAVRKSPIMRIESGAIYAAVGSVGGLPHHPGWYFNLVANPRCRLQDGPRIHDMLAREIRGDEHREWWNLAASAFPHYVEMQAKTTRKIPIVLIEPLARLS